MSRWRMGMRVRKHGGREPVRLRPCSPAAWVLPQQGLGGCGFSLLRSRERSALNSLGGEAVHNNMVPYLSGQEGWAHNP